MTDTIYALSSGSPPAAIAVVRVSGPAAGDAALALAGGVPEPRRASLRTLRDRAGASLDRALVLFFPAPHTATGEDMLELHCHGGRGVVAAVTRALGDVPGLRQAEAGEFTRRALEHGVIDYAQAEGLADLLTADNEHARAAAMAGSEGAVGRSVGAWSDELATIRAIVEGMIDYEDEDDVAAHATFAEAHQRLAWLCDAIAEVLARPTIERLREGPLVVLAGPPNAGKSSLLNALCERDVSIVTAVPGTTRDVIEVAVERQGQAIRLVDTAGLTDSTDDVIERIGVGRARDHIAAADVVLWLGDPEDAPEQALLIHARADAPGRNDAPNGSLTVSVHWSDTIDAVWTALGMRLGEGMVVGGTYLRERQRVLVGAAAKYMTRARDSTDPLILAEELRGAATSLESVSGEQPNEAMLTALFSRFCVGK